MDELVFDHTYGSDKDRYGRPRQKEGPILTFYMDNFGISMQAERVDYDLACPWECVTLSLDDEEVEKLRDFLNDYLRKD